MILIPLVSFLVILTTSTPSLDNPIPDYVVESTDSEIDLFIPLSTFSSSSASVYMTFLNLPSWLTATMTDPNYIGATGSLGSYAFDSYVVGRYAYVAEFYNGLTIVDVLDPSSPSKVTSCCNDVFGRICDARDVAVVGNYAYLGCEDVDGTGIGILRIVDISNPASPVTTGDCVLSKAYDIWVSPDGNTCYVADGIGGLKKVNTATKSNPTKTNEITSFTLSHGVFYDDGYVYVAGESDGLRIIDDSTFTIESTYSDLLSEDIQDVHVQGNFAYLADNHNGLVILDVSQKSNPTMVGKVATLLGAKDVEVENDYAFLVEYDGGSDGVCIVDVKDKQSPKLLSAIPITFATYGLYVKNNLLYVSADDGGLIIYKYGDFRVEGSSPLSDFSEFCGRKTITVKAEDDGGHRYDYFDLVFRAENLVCSQTEHCDPDSNLCVCNDHYYGEDCDVTICWDVYSNESSINVCSGRGACVGYNHCQCDGAYYGNTCDVYECFGVLSNSSEIDSICSDQGSCVDINTCHCDGGYYGTQCDVTICGSIYSNQTEEVCGGNGDCKSFNRCDCVDDYYGTDCSITTCNEVLSNETDIVCSNHGSCETLNECECNNNYDGSDCEIWITSCFGILSNESSLVCGGHGTCEKLNNCTCMNGYAHPLVNGSMVNYETCEANGDDDDQGDDEDDDDDEYSFLDWVLTGVGIAAGTTFGSVFVIIISVGFCVLCLLFCCAFIACVMCCCYSCGKFGDKSRILSDSSKFIGINGKSLIRGGSGIDQILRVQLLEEENNRNQKMASIKINERLFEIDYNDLQVIQSVAKGSNSMIFLCMWKNLQVAFKCFFTSDLFNSQQDFDEFEKEVNVMSSIRHPNCVDFYGCSIHPPRVGIVMEYCENGDLRDFLGNQQDYPMEQRFRILREVTDGFEYLHDRNVIHRDVKSANILIGKDHSAKIIDFGLSRIIEKLNTEKTKNVGTCCYMAPEVVLGGDYSEKCDVFSFSIVMWEVVCGNFLPYGKDTPTFRIEYKVANDPAMRPDISKIPLLGCLSNPETRNKFIEILKSCWDHDPNNRFSFGTLGSVLSEFESIDKSNSISKGKRKRKAPPPPPPPVRRRKREDDDDAVVVVEKKGLLEESRNDYQQQEKKNNCDVPPPVPERVRPGLRSVVKKGGKAPKVPSRKMRYKNL